jgi:glutathione transport system substrate-binding protein
MQTEGPRSLDPANHTATLTAAILDPVYEGLVRLTADGAAAPALATAWEADADRRAWTFTLRHGVRFHDGEALDAAAVAASFRRLIEPGSALAAAGKFTPVIGTADAVGDHAVRLRLKGPYADLLVLLASNQASIVSPRAARSGALARSAVGTGPFAFVDWRPEDSVTLRRNDAYWGAPARFETLRWSWSSEPSVLYMALRSGEADVVAPLSPIFARRAAADRSLRLIHRHGTAFFWVALNMGLAPIDDWRVRQALNEAVDRQALVDGLLGGFGQAATAPLADATPFVRPDPARLRFDPASARRRLAAAGHARGLRIAVAAQEEDELLAQALQAMWREVGVGLEIRRLEGGVYAQAAFASPRIKRREGLGGVLASWSSGVAPDLQLRPLFASASAAPAGANLGFFQDPGLDRLLDAAEAADDVGDRRALYAAAQSRIDAAAPEVPLYTRDDLVGVHAGVFGIDIRPGGELVVTGAAKA